MSSSRRGAARAAVLFGLLAVLTLPVDVLVADRLKGVQLLQSLYVAVPIAALFALTALAASRRARFTRARSVHADGGSWATRFAWAGVYAAVVGGIALAVYGGLRAAQ